MATLNTKPNFDVADDVYAEILAAHDGLSLDQSQKINAKLVLILANHIGDREILRDAMALAKKRL